MTPRVEILVRWIIWTLFVVILLTRPFLMGRPLLGREEHTFVWQLTAAVLVPLAIATGLRWLLPPRLSHGILGLFILLVGCILANMGAMMILFLDVSHPLALHLLCVAVLLQFIPL